jgi:hypothetical protein
MWTGEGVSRSKKPEKQQKTGFYPAKIIAGV